MSNEPRTDWQETTTPGDQARYEGYGEVIRQIQLRRDVDGVKRRGLHPKHTGCAEAEFVVRDDVPAHARVGIFATGGTFKSYVRFSNGASRVQHDAKGDVRGLALKVVGVPGTKLIEGMLDARTQDFLMIADPAIPFRDADEFMFLIKATRTPWLLVPKMIGRFGFGRFLAIAKTARTTSGVARTSVTQLPYYTPVPIKFGDYAAKYSVRPRGGVAGAPVRGNADHLRDELAERLAAGAAEFDFGVQLYVDAVKTPIEDATVEWREADTPWIALATLRLPRQDLRSERGRAVVEYVDKLSFDPWHAPAEFRPLGDIMRARKQAYFVSGSLRGSLPEPDGTETF